ncbi:MAG: DUF4394 domain-containing protein [Nocardioidaceae bacterium]
MNGKTAGGKTAGLFAAVAGLAATSALSGPSAVAGADSAERTNNDLYGMGLSNHKIQRIVRFSTDNPEAARVISKVNGLMGDTKLVGFDYWVQNNRLYGVGDSGGVYTIRPFTGKVMKVSQIGVPLDGTNFGVDFNPAADRLRIISDTGQNLRHDVNAGGVTTVDGTLVKLQATGFAAGQSYDVSVLSDDGRKHPAGEFVGTGEKEMRCNLNSSVLRDEATGFEVRNAQGKVVLVSPGMRALPRVMRLSVPAPRGPI